jgi:hypothetical protein
MLVYACRLLRLVLVQWLVVLMLMLVLVLVQWLLVR